MRTEVCLRIRGLMPEKLIERARALGVDFRSIEPLGDHEIVVGVGAADAEKLRSLCRRYAIPCEVVSRRGRSALREWLKRRWTLAFGLLIGLVACWAFLAHIWLIDIRFIGDNAQTGDARQVAAALLDLDIRPGISRVVDTKLLSEELTARCEGLSYVGVRAEGVRLLIEVAPESASPEVYALDDARDLYADRSGIVVSLNVESGTVCVRPGDTVRRGQVVIRGEERSADDATRSIAALGEVIVRAWFEGSAEGPLTAVKTEYTGRRASSSTLVTPWFSLPVTRSGGFGHEAVVTDTLPIGGLYLPVRIERVTRLETRERREKVDRAALEAKLSALALSDARCRLCAEGPEAYEITRSWTRVQRTGKDALRVSAVCEINTNTAVTIETLRQGG